VRVLKADIKERYNRTWVMADIKPGRSPLAFDFFNIRGSVKVGVVMIFGIGEATI